MADRRLELVGYHRKISLLPPDFKGKCGNDGVIGQDPKRSSGYFCFTSSILSTK